MFAEHSTGEPRVAKHRLRTLASGFPLYAVGMVKVQEMNCAGDTGIPMTLNLASSRSLEIRLALGPTAFGVIAPLDGDPTTHDA